MMKYISTILLSLLLVIAAVNAVEVKLGLVMSGSVDDLGFNYMVNYARVKVERQLEFAGTMVGSNIITFDDTYNTIKGYIKNGANVIICSSFEHTAACYKLAAEYTGVKFLIRDVPCQNNPYTTCAAQPDNVGTSSFDLGFGHYVIGYVSALYSQTRKVGMVVPGAPSLGWFTVNAFTVGVNDAVANHNPSSPVTVYVAKTGSWLDQDREAGATKRLIFDYGVDVIGMSQDDLTVQDVCLENNVKSFGTSGFPLFNIMGEAILTSCVYDWTNVFYNITSMVKYNNFTKFAFDGSYQKNDIIVDGLSFLLGDTNKGYVNATLSALSALTNVSQSIYFCDPLFKQSGYKVDQSGCVSQFDYLVSPYPLNGIVDTGYYIIPTSQVLVKDSIKLGFSIATGVAGFVALCLLIGIFAFRNTKIMRSASPLFCMAIILGGMIIFAGIISWAQNPTTPLCRVRVWLLSLGYTIMLGNMVVKNFRIWLIFDNPQLKKLKITNAKLLPYISALIAINCILLGIYTGVGKIHSVQSFGRDGIGKYEYLDVCEQTRAGNIALYIVLIYHALMLLVGCFVSWKIRTVDIAEFNESKPIANTLYAISLCLFIIIPLMVSLQTIESQVVIICASALFTTGSSLIILFLPKFWRLYVKGLNADPFSSSSNSSFVASVNKQSGMKSAIGMTDMNSNIESVVVSAQEDS